MSDPIKIIFKAADSVGDRKIFGRYGDIQTIQSLRREPTFMKGYWYGPTLHTIGTPLTDDMLYCIHSCRTVHRMVLVGGPSGSGKTHGIVSLSSEARRWIVVYIRPEWKINNDRLRKASALAPNEFGKARARGASVLEFIASEVDDIIPDAAREAMARLDERSELHVIVCLDDVGRCTNAVKALCALSGGDVKNKMVRRWKQELPWVKFHVVAAGTGIGWSDTYDPRHAYVYDGGHYDHQICQYRWAESEVNRCQVANLEIFLSYFSLRLVSKKTQTDEKEDSPASSYEITFASIQDKVDPHFLQLVCGNAGFASCAGATIAPFICGAFAHTEMEKVLLRTNLGNFIGIAAMKYKSLGSLSQATPRDLFGYLLKAVQMHYFPYTVDAAAAHEFEVRHGLVQNLTLLQHCEDFKKRSPIRLPHFSVALLSELIGLPAIAKSVVCGERFDVCVFGVFFLLACSTGGSSAFTAILDRGFMGPVKEEEYWALSPNTFEKNTIDVCPLMHDMSSMRAEEGDSFVDSTSTCASAGGGRSRVGATIVETVRIALTKHAEDHKAERSPMHVAVFRSPVEAAFADVFILMGDTMYLLQTEEVKSAASVDVDFDRWKMGADDANAMEAANAMRHFAQPDGDADANEEEVRCPRAIIGAIAKAWAGLMSIPVKHIRPYIVLPLNECARDMARRLANDQVDALIALDGVDATLHKVRAVSAEDIEFLPHSPKEKKGGMAPVASYNSARRRVQHIPATLMTALEGETVMPEAGAHEPADQTRSEPPRAAKRSRKE